MSGRSFESEFQFPALRAVVNNGHERQVYETTAEALQAALAREAVLLRERDDLARRQIMLAQEFEHRLVNSVQLIVSLLSLQSRAATTPEATAQLAIAARRIAALGRVHRRLHLLDHDDTVEFKQYLQQLCADLSELLLQDGSGYALLVEGAECEIPTSLGIPLGFIVNELVTNAAKYARGHITVRIETTVPACHAVSVLDDGRGLPEGFDPAKSKGLGMKIVLSLVKQIGGTLHFSAGDHGRGTRFMVTFSAPDKSELRNAAREAGASIADDPSPAVSPSAAPPRPWNAAARAV